jgi:uncharacterized membrane protein HdeD (DUF308 family)
MAVTAHEASLVLKETVRDSIRNRSFLVLVQGALLVAAGVAAILSPLLLNVGAIKLLGWLLILAGAVQVVSLLGAKEAPSFWLHLTAVVLDILVGLLLLANPYAGFPTFALLMLVMFVVAGMERIVFALMIRPMRAWGWVLASGAVTLVCAFILFGALPHASAWLLGLLLGAHLLAVGAADILLARRIRKGATDAPAGES